MRCRRRAIGIGIGLDAAHKVANDFLPIDDIRPQSVRGYQRYCQIDRRGRCLRWRRPEQKFRQARGTAVGAEQVPATVDNKRRIGLVMRQHVVEGAVDRREVRHREIALLPGRGIAGRHQQCVLLPQRQRHRGTEPQDHVPARCGPPRLDKAHVALRRSCRERQTELRDPAAAALFLEESTKSAPFQGGAPASRQLGCAHRTTRYPRNERPPIPPEGIEQRRCRIQHRPETKGGLPCCASCLWAPFRPASQCRCADISASLERSAYRRKSVSSRDSPKPMCW